MSSSGADHPAARFAVSIIENHSPSPCGVGATPEATRQSATTVVPTVQIVGRIIFPIDKLGPAAVVASSVGPWSAAFVDALKHVARSERSVACSTTTTPLVHAVSYRLAEACASGTALPANAIAPTPEPDDTTGVRTTSSVEAAPRSRHAPSP